MRMKNFRKYLIILPLFLSVLMISLNVRAAGEVDTNFIASAFLWTQGATSQTIVQPDGKIIIGGSFRVVRKYGRNLIARLNADGTIDLTFNPVELRKNSFGDGFIRSLALQADGKIIVGGAFSLEGSGNRGLIRLNQDGSLDSTFSDRANINSLTEIYDLVVTPDGKIFYATYNSVGRLNGEGLLEGQISDTLRNLATQSDGKIVAYNSSSFKIVRYNQDFTVDSSFQQPAISQLVNDIVIQADGKIIIAGALTAVNGFPISRIARLNIDGTTDSTFNIGTIGANNAIKIVRILADGKILIGGEFTTFNTAEVNYVALLNPTNGSLDTSFNTGISAFPVNDLAVQTDGKIIVAGSLIIRLNPNGILDNSFILPTIGDPGYVRKVFVQPDNKILVGGYFTKANEKTIRHLARFNADGTVDNSFNQTYLPENGTIYAIAVQADGKVVAGGDGFAGGVRFNADGSFDRLISTGAIVEDIKIQPDGKILMSGAGYVKRFNADGSADTSFTNPITNVRIYKIALQPDGKILIGGSFTQINATPRSGVARLNADGSLDTTFNPLGGTSGAVLDLILQSNGKIIIGGDFTGVNFDTNKKYVARLNADGSLDTTFAPVLDTRVRSLKLQSDGKILFGGITNLIVGNPVPGKLGRLNADGTLDTTFNNTMPIDQVVNSIDLQTDNKIILGGYFSRVNGVANLGTARLLNSARGVFDFDGDSKTDLSIFRPAVGEWWYLRSSDSGNYAAQFGTSNDKLVPADFTGDGKTDIAFWRPSSGEWFILRSEDNSFYAFPFGTTGDISIVGNFDTDNLSDVGVFRPSNTTWYIQKSLGGTDIVQFGVAGDVPVTGDYDGDGKTDIAI
ncbi:MAG TPA: hypothetical protein PKE69_09650, partial [Pyrinomonadaceae bacterium]|nr:hypothetical protein [Pyrinomonadaceae bacterium]